MFWVSLVVLTVAATVEVVVTPDQPMPFVYVDDPLIIELSSTQDVTVNGSVLLQAAHTGGRVEIPLDSLFIRGGTAYWFAAHDAPRERGYYMIEVSGAAGETTFRSQTRFCRIDRPTQLNRLPVYAHCGGDSSSLMAVRSVGVDTVRFPVDSEHAMEISAVASDLGMHQVVVLTASQLENMPESLTSLMADQCETILRFEIADMQTTEGRGNPMDLLRQGGCPAGVSVVVPDAEAFETLLRNHAQMGTRHATVAAADWPAVETLIHIRDIGAQYGMEGWQIHVANPGWRPRGAEQAATFIHRFFEYRAAGAGYIGVNATVVADDVGVQEMMSYLNGLALRYKGHAYVGALAAPASTHALLFRSDGAWLAVLWSEQTTGEVKVPVDGAINLELTDALGNVIAPVTPDNGHLQLTVGRDPLYLTGHGGVILGRAAAQQASAVAARFLARQGLREYLPNSLFDLFTTIESEPRGSGGRLRYLELLRLLPRLEEQWHSRQTPRPVAALAIVAVSELARALALVEEDRGEHFLEPLSDTLSRTEELQSLYLTGSTGTARARERGDWILSEVRRLIEEAEALDRGDRKIEAAAVAALAEWRAECLKFAAQADSVRETPALLPLTVTPPSHAQTEESEGEQSEDSGTVEQVDVTKAPGEVAPEVSSGDDETVATPRIHKVASGDSPYAISKKYGIDLDDFLKWNNLTRRSILRVGQELNVSKPNSN